LVSTCTYYCHLHSAFSHLLEREDIQFGAYSEILVFRMDCEELNLSSLVFAMQFIRQKSNSYSIQFGNPDSGFLILFTDRFDLLSLTRSPIRVNRWIDFGAQYLLERTENWSPCQ